QVKQATFANERAQARVDVGDADEGELAQTQLALENFRATLLASQANVLQRQAALLNILGLPPYESELTTPTTPMADERIAVDWELINDLAQRQRPDIIELKLILEADQQQLILADNQARPVLNGVALYRWNGLEGVVPAGNRIRSADGAFTDWSLGVNFSVPFGLRAGRAGLRQQRLILQRDRANLDQGLHQMQHLLALSLRNLDQFYSQYERFQAVRRAARINLEQQLAQFNEGLVQFIVVLQAISDWGNAVSSEAQALSQYNTELANLELQTGTILESHEIVFFEERFRGIGPLGRLAPEECYPYRQPPSPSADIYGSGEKPSEEYFGLEDPVERRDPEEDQGMIEIDDMKEEDVQFEKVDGDSLKGLSDEEIDRILGEGKAPIVGEPVEGKETIESNEPTDELKPF
ncbi:MAG: TolC family protein, partial [Planctomycetota bacterium]